MPKEPIKMPPARRRRTSKASPVQASVLAALLFAIFTLFLPYPVLWLWSIVAPTEVVGVQIEGRSVHENYGFYNRAAPQTSESFALILRTDQGEPKRVDVNLALYQRATGAFSALNTLALEQTRMLEVPVRLLVLPDGAQMTGIVDSGADLAAQARENHDLRPSAVLALGALALNGLMLSLIIRPARVPLDRRIVWGGGVAGFVAGMVWMLA